MEEVDGSISRPLLKEIQVVEKGKVHEEGEVKKNYLLSDFELCAVEFAN